MGRAASALVILAALVCCLLSAGCVARSSSAGSDNASRDAIPVTDDAYGDSAQSIVYLEQGWTPAQSMDFYTRTQGSRLVPYAWFLALEQAGNETPFRDNAHIERLRYLPQRSSAANPDGLPVGFVKDPPHSSKDVAWMGLNCAACHVTQINYKGVGMRIDGGPGMGDVETMLHELAGSLKATLDDSAKFERFAARVLGGSTASLEQKKALKIQLANVLHYRELFETNKPASQNYGFARVDAFGIILNKVLARDLDLPENLREANAPVSFPFLWDTPQHDVVQWNGSAPNAHLGSLARNVGEVLGVFGEVSIAKHDSENIGPGYKSSVQVLDLVQTEQTLRKLWSPEWPRQLPAIDTAKAARGKAVFQDRCASCHAPISRTDPSRKVTAHMTPIDAAGTDKQMALNFATRTAKTGRLEGKPKYVIVGTPLPATAPGDEILVNAVVGVILNSPFRDYTDSDLLNIRQKPGLAPHVEAATKPSYKARPLNGIWATAPYLHNGSVPNLYQLLLPAEKRVSDFYVGKREFDPVNVGFVFDKFEGGFHFLTKDESGNVIPGNSNAGHEYGTGKDGKPELTDDEKWEVVEYMKTL